jgi:hypothetical protein
LIIHIPEPDQNKSKLIMQQGVFKAKNKDWFINQPKFDNREQFTRKKTLIIWS